ncbi:MAG: DUF2341 domain-containing protein, partial [Candidatus Nanoarchaeia archaeon]
DFIDTITVLSNGITNFSYSSFENLTLIYQGGTFEFPENNLTLGNATTLEFRTTNELNLSVVELLDNSLITHTLNTYSQDYIVNLSAENLSIATGARINVNSKGYAPNYGPGNGTSAETQPTPRSGAGAGYGGLGGNASNSTDVYLQEGQTYGSKVRPLQIGSGGGNCTANSVAFYGGGGLVFLNVTDTLTLNGYISANGSDGSVSTPPGNSSSVGSGGGSGGAIYLYVNNIIGSGDIMADGGKGGQGTLSQGGGGGGGRIAVYYHTREFTGQNTTYGGTGLGNGEEGTVYWNDMIPPNITLVQPEINGTVETDGTVNFTFVVSSDVDVVNCTAYVNNEAYAENTSDIYLDSDYNITTFLIPGTYDWNMHCIDDGDYEGISETWNFTLVMETTPPTVSLEYPDDNDILSLNLIDFLYNVTDNFIVANCSLIINDEVNITTTEPIHQNEAGLNLTTYLHDGDYTWSINCTDTANNEGASETRNVSIGYVARNITIELLEPTADTSVQQYALFNFTVNVSCYDADCGNINVSLDPEWYNTEWQYRQKVYVSEGSDTLDGYQLNISINSANNGTNFNWSRECEDIRFTNIYNTELKYWIESCNSANQAAAIFVKLDNTITQANPYIYMYYGNDEVTNNSNGTETFDFYDDFLDENINPEVWYNQTSGSGYAMNIENGALNLSVVYNGAGQASVVSYAQFTTNKSVETLARVRYQGTYDYNIMFSNLYGLTAGQITYTGSSDRWYIGSGNSYERITTDNWYKMQMVANDTAVNLYVNDTFKASSPISNTTTSIKVMAYIPDASWDDVSHSQYDWIRVRRYMDIQPNYTIGEEVPGSEAS